MDSLLRDAYEKKLNIRRHISCLMAELKDTQTHLALQEERFALEMRNREVNFRFFFLPLENLSKQTGVKSTLINHENCELYFW